MKPEEVQFPTAQRVQFLMSFDTNLAPSRPLPATIRRQALNRALRNLIDNALSFSPPGGTVRVKLKREPRHAVIEVEDDGPGIPPEHLEDVFKRFYTSRPDEHFGRNSGLGLSISKQIVDVHDGTIRAANRPGPTPGSRAGAVFTIRLKLP